MTSVSLNLLQDSLTIRTATKSGWNLIFIILSGLLDIVSRHVAIQIVMNQSFPVDAAFFTVLAIHWGLFPGCAGGLRCDCDCCGRWLWSLMLEISLVCAIGFKGGLSHDFVFFESKVRSFIFVSHLRCQDCWHSQRTEELEESWSNFHCAKCLGMLIWVLCGLVLWSCPGKSIFLLQILLRQGVASIYSQNVTLSVFPTLWGHWPIGSFAYKPTRQSKAFSRWIVLFCLLYIDFLIVC